MSDRIRRCPNCKSGFPADDPVWFCNHLKTCRPAEETEAQRDARQVAEGHDQAQAAMEADTPYEKRKFLQDERQFGREVAAKNHVSRTAYKKKGA
jgi:hypothetical protein